MRQSSTTTPPRRGYGTVRELPSGKFQVRYTGPDGQRRTIGTYPTKPVAETALAGVLTDVHRGSYRAPELGAIRLADYATRWLDRQHELAPRTRALYADLLRAWVLGRHELPSAGAGRARAVDLSGFEVRALSPSLVAEWHAAVVHATRASALGRAQRAEQAASTPAQDARAWARSSGLPVAASGRLSPDVLAAWRAAGAPRRAEPVPARPDAGRTRAAQAYRLLRTICSAAVREQMLPANPCQIPRAGLVRPAERVPASPLEVEQIAAQMPERYRAAVLVAAWSGLRASELFALERRHVDVERGTVRVEHALVEVTGAPVTFGPPKGRSDVGRRTVHLPPATAAALADHLERFTPGTPRALVFGTGSGRPLRSGPRTRMFGKARLAAGRPDLRWHDLRHTGATLAAGAGATLAELQRRLGHSTVAAALVYQHASDDSDRRLAQRLAALEHADNVVPLRPAVSA